MFTPNVIEMAGSSTVTPGQGPRVRDVSERVADHYVGEAGNGDYVAGACTPGPGVDPVQRLGQVQLGNTRPLWRSILT